jgi:hypothetical protein
MDDASITAWNAWLDASLDAFVEQRLIPAIGDALGRKAAELRREIRKLREQVTTLEMKLADMQRREADVIELPAGSWRRDR